MFRWLLSLWSRGLSPAAARNLFERDRGALQERFFATASTSGKPRGLRWKNIDWEPGLELARQRADGQLLALVGVTIEFEAIEGSDMEDLPAVGNLRNASALFFWHQEAWHTTGKVIFNLNPDEVVSRFGQTYERVESNG